MNIFLKMAWRNIWRNKTRTFLTACVVFIAVVLSILMTSEQYGLYDKMIDNVIEITGHLQVQNKEYWGNKKHQQCRFDGQCADRKNKKTARCRPGLLPIWSLLRWLPTGK